MNLLFSIFPGLTNSRDADLPKWGREDRPWDILRDGENGLQHQISNFLEGGEGVFIHPSAIIGESVSIEGPSYVGPKSVIRHGALLRKGSWICGGSVVGHCTEVKNSVLLPGAKAPHFNYVGDSIVGFGSNLGAGVKLSNVRNDRQEIKISLPDGSRISSGMSKLGALIGDCAQIGCNVVSNPGTIISPNSMIKPNETISGWFDSGQ